MGKLGFILVKRNDKKLLNNGSKNWALYSLFFIAAMHGHYQMVEILLGQGAEINAADKNGWTPLHCKL